MGYNKKVLSEATKKLNKPSKKKVANNDLIPFVSTSGYKQGEPPAGTNYRIPSNTIYNPTPYNILAVASTGEERIIPAGDTSTQTFDGAEYVDEYELKKGGQKTNTKKYSRSLSATNKLFDKNPLFKKPKSKKKKIFDPNAKYYQIGGINSPVQLTPYYSFDQPQSPEAWQADIKNLERQLGNPVQWTMDDHTLMQNKLNDYKAWRETTPEGQAVIDYHNEPNEYVIPIPYHLRNKQKGGNFQDTKYFQIGGETDSWGRKSDSPWYGFDPDKKQFTTKDQWGRSPGDKWYGFNPDNKTWTKGTKASSKISGLGNLGKTPLGPTPTSKMPKQPLSGSMASSIKVTDSNKSKTNNISKEKSSGLIDLGTYKGYGSESDSGLENLTEWFDPTGYFSWDDAGDAYENWRYNQRVNEVLYDKTITGPTFSQAMDMFGAVPMLGKLGKIKYITQGAGLLAKPITKFFDWQKMLNRADFAEDEYGRLSKGIQFLSLPKLQGKFQDGGYLELDLTPKEIEQYKKDGYVVEELPKAQTGLNTNPYTTVDSSTGLTRPMTEEEKAQHSLKFMQGWASSPMHKEMLRSSIIRDNPQANIDEQLDIISGLRSKATNPSISILPPNNKMPAIGEAEPYMFYDIEDSMNLYGVDKNKIPATLPSTTTFYTQGRPGEHVYVYPHEFSHIQDMSGSLMPVSDKSLIKSYRNQEFLKGLADVKQNTLEKLGYQPTYDYIRDYYPNLERYAQDKEMYENDFNKFQKQYADKDYFESLSDNKLPYEEFIKQNAKNKFWGDVGFKEDYIGTHTETRARLNAIRQMAKDYGIYDPYTEKLTPEKYKEIENLFRQQNPNEYDVNQLRQLKEVFSDDEIFNMMNTISKNDSSNSDLTKAQKGGIPRAQQGIFIDDPKEYKYRKAMYDDSLHLYNKTKLFDEFVSKLPGYMYKNQRPVASWYYDVSNKEGKEFHPINRTEAWVKSLSNANMMKIADIDYSSDPRFKRHPLDIRYDKPNPGYSDKVHINYSKFKKPVQPVFFKAPEISTSEIGTLPIRPLPQVQTPELIEGQKLAKPQRYQPIKTAKRMQTVMEPDPDRPGKYRVKGLRRVDYAAHFPGEGWESMDAPRVIWINERGEEVSQDPRLNTLNLENITFQKGGQYYTFPGSEGVYRKVGDKWEVDWNRSGNFQPLSKGDVAERTAKLNKGAKQLFDQDYYDLVENRNQAFQSAPAKQVAKKPTAQQIAAQKVFDKDFKVTSKSNYEKVEDQIQKDIQEAKKLYEQSGLEWTKADEDEIANRRWNLSGVGTQYDSGVIQTPSKSTTYFNAPENPTFGDYAGKVWDIITNPIDYFNYSVATGDMMNAPWDITDYERALDKLGEEDPILSRNAVGKGLDLASYFNPAAAALQAIKTAAEIPGLIGKARQTGDWSDAGWALGETALEMIPGMGAIDDITKGVKKVYNTAKPVAQTIGEGAYYFGKNVGESLTPGTLRKYRKKSEKLAFERAELQDKSIELWKQNQEIERDIITAKYKLHQLKSNRTQDIATKQQIIKLQNKIDELSRLRNNAKLVDDKILYSEELSPYQQIGTMKSVVTDPGTGQNIDYIYDFETKEKIPFDIQVPGQEVTLELKEGIPVKTETFIPDFSFNPKYADTQNKNIAFVQKVLPGSKPFGSSVFHNIGVAHASNDIDVAMTASDWSKVKKNVSIDQSKQAKYGPTINLGDEFGSQGKIDVNIIQENPKTGMAEGEFATELFRQFFPDEFYKETQRLVEQGITKSINLKNLPSLSISKTPQELMDAYDPEIKSILDAYEATPQVRSGLNLNKTKQINRIDYILETSTDYNKVAKAQELFTKSIVGSKGSIGYQFSEDQLSDFSENLKILKDIGVTKHNLSKIASDPKRMQLFLNDFYINNSIYNREISLVPEYIKTPEDLFNAYTQWKGKGASAMGMGTNSITLGTPKFANMDQDVTGSIYYDLIKNKKYNTPKEYVDDIIKQTSGNRQLESAEVTQLKNIAEKYNIKIDEKKLPKTLGDLLDPETFGMTSIPEDVSNIDNFYKEAASLLGAKAIQRGFFAGSKYTTLLNDFDKKFDALTLSFNKYVPVLKSQTERFTNLANTSNLTNIGIIEKDYYKLKHYLDGGLDELVKKKNEALEFQKLFDEKIAKTAIQYVSKKNPTEVERLLKERQDLNDKIITLTDTIDELNRRRDKIQIIRPGILLAVATAATGLGIYESSKSYKSDKKSKYKLELETLNQIEKETGKLSPQDEFRRKELKKFITNKKEGGTHNIGDEIELTDEQVREWQRLGYTLEIVK